MPIKGRLKNIQHRLNLSRKVKESRKKFHLHCHQIPRLLAKQENPCKARDGGSVGYPKSTEKIIIYLFFIRRSGTLST
jgi:hypothetical protein